MFLIARLRIRESMRMMAIMNQKGGVGKTTTTLNLAHALARKGKNVLAIDLDPQSHLTAGFGALDKDQAGIADVLLDEAGLKDVTVNVRENVYLVPAGERLGEVEHISMTGAQRGFLLREALKKRRRGMDYVLIDCPPSSGLLGMNALLAVEEVLIPVSGDFFALQGMSRLISIFSHIESSLHKKLKKRVVLTRFHERRKLAREVRSKIINHFPKSVYKTAIRESVALAESPGFGQTIFEYQSNGNGAEDYRSLADDVVKERTTRR